MEEQNKMTTQELKRLARSLSRTADTMKLYYSHIEKYAYLELLCISFLLFVVGSTNTIISMVGSSYYPILMLLAIDVTMIYAYLKMAKNSNSFRNCYHEGMRTLQIMSDMAEWTRYKRRLIYQGTEESVSKSVNDFFMISEKTWSPFRSEMRYFRIMVLSLPMMIIYSLIIVVIKVFLNT